MFLFGLGLLEGRGQSIDVVLMGLLAVLSEGIEKVKLGWSANHTTIRSDVGTSRRTIIPLSRWRHSGYPFVSIPSAISESFPVSCMQIFTARSSQVQKPEYYRYPSRIDHF